MMPGTGPEALNEEQKRIIRAELDRILASPAFRSTRRCREFLGYAVNSALDGKLDQLKERVIGIDVFDRAPDYSPGDDSIVRVKANELRKRLAQYYRDADCPVQIELPLGSYVPEFRWRTAEAPADAAPSTATPSRHYRIAAAAVILVAAAWLGIWLAGSSPAIDDFWRPVLKSPKPVLVAVAHPAVYLLSRDARETPDSMIPLGDITRDSEHYVGVGDALALARFSEFFTRVRKAHEVRISTEASFADLRSSPAVLIGAYSNQWTMKMTEGLRFVFDNEAAAGSIIRDTMSPGHRWARTPSDPLTDYAIVSRISDSPTGDLIVIAAGLSHFGTQVAGEFLTDAGLMEEAFRNAPGGWEKKNIQLVLKAEVIGKTPARPKVLDSCFW